MTQDDIKNDVISEGLATAGNASEGDMDEVETVNAQFRVSREIWDAAISDADTAQALVLWVNSQLGD